MLFINKPNFFNFLGVSFCLHIFAFLGLSIKVFNSFSNISQDLNIEIIKPSTNVGVKTISVGKNNKKNVFSKDDCFVEISKKRYTKTPKPKGKKGEIKASSKLKGLENPVMKSGPQYTAKKNTINQTIVPNTKTMDTQQDAFEDVFSLQDSVLDDQESITEVGYVKTKVEAYRNFGGLCAKGLDQVEMIFEVNLNSDGSISFVDYIGDNAKNLIGDKIRITLIDQNLRAIKMSSPFTDLDPQRYQYWRKLRLKFTQH